MTRLTLASAILASFCSITAVAAPRYQTQFVQRDFEGSQLLRGDALVADGAGKVGLYRGNVLVAMLHDPEDVLSQHANAPLYVTDAEGKAVRDIGTFAGDLFISADAPQIVLPNRDAVAARALHAQSFGAGKPGGSSTLMTAHGGTVLTSNTTMAIYWGAWNTNDPIVAGLDKFFGGWGTSGMAKDSTEYAGTNGQVTASSSYSGHVFDASAAPGKALSTSQAVGEACKITNNNPVSNAVYFIYTSTGAGHVNYCAWHSWGTCSNGAQIQVAYMPNITGIAGCDPVSDVTSNEGLAALANVTSHELSEAITDPRGAGWFDSSGAENGDKCAWSFNNNVNIGGASWKLQMEWSNKAYSAGTGFLNRSGEAGCLQ